MNFFNPIDYQKQNFVEVFLPPVLLYILSEGQLILLELESKNSWGSIELLEVNHILQIFFFGLLSDSIFVIEL
jgi:hypothetical protein